MEQWQRRRLERRAVTLLDVDYRVTVVVRWPATVSYVVEVVRGDEVEHLKAMPDRESAEAMLGYLRLALAALVGAWVIADDPQSWRHPFEQVRAKAPA